MLWLSCSSRLHFISEIITLLFRIYNLKRLNKYQQSSTCRLLIFEISIFKQIFAIVIINTKKDCFRGFDLNMSDKSKRRFVISF